MKKIFMYAHGGSGNHGCEAIVKSTINIINDDMYLISEKPEEDIKYGTINSSRLIIEKNEINKKSLDFIKAYFDLKIRNKFVSMDKLNYKEAFSNFKHGDIALSIGGDNYCYANVSKYMMLHDILKRRNITTVLWGCSVEPKLLEDKEICKDIKNYSLITARESISYEALKKVNNNTYLVSDPAFCLIPKEVELPELFVENNTLGINLSPMVIDNENIAGVTIKNYENLINYIIENTNLQIALIPHVVWENGDDRGPLKKLYLMYKNTDRVMLVDDYDSQELKYIISKCKFFIGARTHSTIAAYSSCIPTIVIGYSVKAKGIAKDIFGSFENYVIPVQSLSDEFTLVHGIEWLIKKEISIREHLKSIMPEYIEKARKANELLKKIGDENV